MADALIVPDFAAITRTADGEALLAGPPAFIDLLPVAAFACSVTGNICWANAKAAELWGREPEPGERIHMFSAARRIYGLDGGLIADEETPTAFALRTGEPATGTEVIERPDGETRTVAVHVAPLRDAAGSLIGALTCFHDVTDELREDRSAREGERQLRDILNALPAAIYTTDAKGRITF